MRQNKLPIGHLAICNVALRALVNSELQAANHCKGHSRVDGPVHWNSASAMARGNEVKDEPPLKREPMMAARGKIASIATLGGAPTFLLIFSTLTRVT